MHNHDRWTDLVSALDIDLASTPAAGTHVRATATVRQSDPNDPLFRSCADGERTQHLTRLAGWLLSQGIDAETATTICLQWNATNDPPLPDEKVVSTCASIARSDLRNHPERYAAANDPSYYEPWFDPEDARVTRYLTDPPPQREWLVQGLLPKGIVGMLSAPGGSSKSQFLMQLAYAVAQGAYFLARWQIGTPGSVLMLCAEDEEPEIHRRLHRIHQQSGGLDLGVSKRLFIRSTAGERTLLTETTATGEVDMTALVRRLAVTAKLVPDLRLIVIDPASRYRGGEENSNEDATRFIEALEYLAQETGATVLVAHHSNKAALNTSEPSQNSARGASALTDGARWHLTLNKPGKDHSIAKMLGDEARATHVEMALVKTNYTAPMHPVLLRRDEHGQLHCAADGGLAESVLAQIAEIVRTVHSTPGVTRRQLETLIFGVDKPLGISEKAGRELVNHAVFLDYLRGATRGPLTVTDRGLELMGRTVTPKATGAARRGSTPREKL
jgi:hypothetical protein